MQKSGNDGEHPWTHHLDSAAVTVLQGSRFHRSIQESINPSYLPVTFKSELQMAIHLAPQHVSSHRSLTRIQCLSVAFENVCQEGYRSQRTTLRALTSACPCVVPTPAKTWDVSTSPEFPQALSVTESTPWLASTVLIASVTRVLPGRPLKWRQTVHTPAEGCFHRRVCSSFMWWREGCLPLVSSRPTCEYATVYPLSCL